MENVWNSLTTIISVDNHQTVFYILDLVFSITSLCSRAKCGGGQKKIKAVQAVQVVS